MSDSTQNPPPQNPGEGGYTPPPPPPPPVDQPVNQPPTAPPPGQPYPPAPGPGYAPPPSGIGQPAGLGIRFLARLIDGILVGIVNGILSTIIVVGIIGASSSGFGVSPGSNYAASAASAILSAVLYVGYFTLMESRKGTVGKMLLKLQTQGASGGTPTTEEAFKRNAWAGLGILGVIPFLGFIGGLAELVAVIMIAVTINSSPTKQGWHDRFAGGTDVIKVG